MDYTLSSEKATFDFAKKLASQLKGGEIIGLIGNLGAGKTVFSKGIAAGLKIKANITSPTFVIMKVYPVKHGNIKNLCHIDAYRLKSADDLAAIGAKDYFGESDSITIVEWADLVKKILPKRTIYVKITNKSEKERIINLK